MIIFDEKFADELDDGNARRGWFMDIRREQAAALESLDIMQLVEDMGRYVGEHFYDGLEESLSR